jgi:hypothetical protein
MTFRECVFVCPHYHLIYHTLPLYLSVWFVSVYDLYSLQQWLVRPAFLGFDTLWNTPLGKCYNGTFVRLRTLVIVRITIWSYLASLLGTHNLASTLRNTNTCGRVYL